MCDGRVDVYDSGCGVLNTVTIDTGRHQSDNGLSQAKFRRGCRVPFSKGSPLLLEERKTCVQVAFLMGLPVKSAFALLLTRVTEPPAEPEKGIL